MQRESIRFADWRAVGATGNGVSFDDRKTFYDGEHVAVRMDLVRRQINHIRSNWGHYEDYLDGLRVLLGSRIEAVEDEAETLENLFSVRREWNDTHGGTADFSAVRLYTSDSGYEQLFGFVNSEMRSESFGQREIALRSAVFLVELLTIDLFNFCATNPFADSFDGVVYRGMAASPRDLASIMELIGKPVAQRYVAVPLAMLSASKSWEQAETRARQISDEQVGRIPIVWRVRVLDLGTDLVRLYLREFPESVLTSICAVPIYTLSRFTEEQEVLLRGPFMQVLGFGEERSSGRVIQVVDAVMLNSNRDHLSTIASDTHEDRRMRDLFRILVTGRRAAYASEFAMERQQLDDVRQYEEMRARSTRELEAYFEGQK